MPMRLRKIPEIKELHVPKIQAKELILAGQLVSKLSQKTFNINRYKDSFAVKLVKKIHQLKTGVKITPSKKEIAKPKEVSLMKALQASLSKVPTKRKITKK